MNFLKIKCFDSSDKESLIDPMTHVLRKDAMILYVKDLIERKIPFSYFFIDFDYFKKVNDKLGHQIGDKALQKCVSLIQEAVPSESIMGRYGGDEFVLVIENKVRYQDVWQIARTFCQHLRHHPQDFLKNVYQDGKITVTVGISRYPIDGKDFETINLSADHALYRGKTKGRDCFIIFDKAKYSSSENEMNISLPEIISRLFSYFREEKDSFLALKKGAALIGEVYHPRYISFLSEKKDSLLYSKEGIDDTSYIPFPYNDLVRVSQSGNRVVFLSKILNPTYCQLNQKMAKANIHSFVLLAMKRKGETSFLILQSRRERVYPEDENVCLQVLSELYGFE